MLLLKLALRHVAWFPALWGALILAAVYGLDMAWIIALALVWLSVFLAMMVDGWIEARERKKRGGR